MGSNILSSIDCGGNARSVHLKFAMPRGQDYLLQWSGDFVAWSYLSSVQPLHDRVDFTDARIAGAEERFYRATKTP